jgi:hypothetical protein
MPAKGLVGILPAMVAVGLMAGYYVYNLIDADGVVRYVGKGTGRRVDSHLGVILALAAGAPATRASKVHRREASRYYVLSDRKTRIPDHRTPDEPELRDGP